MLYAVICLAHNKIFLDKILGEILLSLPHKSILPSCIYNKLILNRSDSAISYSQGKKSLLFVWYMTKITWKKHLGLDQDFSNLTTTVLSQDSSSPWGLSGVGYLAASLAVSSISATHPSSGLWQLKCLRGQNCPQMRTTPLDSGPPVFFSRMMWTETLTALKGCYWMVKRWIAIKSIAPIIEKCRKNSLKIY